MYFCKFPNVFLPSITPSVSTPKSFSRRIISAVSFVMSTAVSTDIPTSALCIDGASFIPSPMYPTTLPASFKTRTILAFWIGESFANTLVFFKFLLSAASDSFSTLLPSIILSVLIFTFSQIAFVTYSLSPVSTITLIPSLFNLSISSFALSFGGSKNPIKPIKTIFDSSFIENSFIFTISFFCATATTLSPCLFKSFVKFNNCCLMSLVKSETSPL